MLDVDLQTQAQQILRNNSEDACYTVPTRLLYPFQWNWDSCLTALGWITFDEPRAWKEFKSLLSGQCETGMLPHIIFHKPASTYFPGPDVWQYDKEGLRSGISQPPVLATTLRMAYQAAKDKKDAADFIKSHLQHVIAYHKWFHETRDPDNTGLVATYHPWETGRDNSAEWDQPLKRVTLEGLQPYERRDLNLISAEHRPTQRDYDYYVALLQFFVANKYDKTRLYKHCPFKVADIGLNSLLLRANQDLLWLLNELDGDATCAADRDIIKKWIQLQTGAFEQFWSEDSGAFHSIDLIAGEQIPLITSASYLPLLTNAVSSPQIEVLSNKLLDWKHKVNLVPSLSPADENFNELKYWRGPVWLIINFMIARGLQEKGKTELSDKIREGSDMLVQKSGFREYFHPVSGEGLGGEHFSWTAAMYLFWITGVKE